MRLPHSGGTRTGVLPRPAGDATLEFMTIPGHPPAHDADLSGILVESGLASLDQLTAARRRAEVSGEHLDEALINSGVFESALLRRVLSRSWGLPLVVLATEWIDTELVLQARRSRYIEEMWMPVRDQANGTVLVATARFPDDEQVAAVGIALASPIEFAVATSHDIRRAVERIFDGQRRRWFL